MNQSRCQICGRRSIGNSLELTCVSTCWRTHTDAIYQVSNFEVLKKDTMRATSQDFLVSSSDFTDWISRIAATVEPQKNQHFKRKPCDEFYYINSDVAFGFEHVMLVHIEPASIGDLEMYERGRGWAVGPQLTCRDFWSIRSSVLGR